MAPFSGKPTSGFDCRASTGQRWRAFSRPVRPPKRWCRPTRRVISWCSCSSNGNGPRCADYRRRTGRCVSHKSIAVKGATGSSCICMLIRRERYQLERGSRDRSGRPRVKVVGPLPAVRYSCSEDELRVVRVGQRVQSIGGLTNTCR